MNSNLKLVVFYNGFFGERFIANLMNYSNSCPSFGACGLDQCVQCKQGAYSFSKNIVATFGLLSRENMPDFIEDAEDFLPKKIPKADIAVAINIHPDILMALPEKLKESGFKALIVPVEEPRWCSAGLAKQLKESCTEIGLEFAAPKPFCLLRKSEDTPTINRFIDEMGIGYPEFEVDVEDSRGVKKIKNFRVIRSQPCGAGWYIGIKLREFEFKDMRELWDRVSSSHHSFPCTASMEKDNEYNETLLHVAGYTARHAVDKAIGYEGDEDIPEHLIPIVKGST
ncbi:Uncharacterized protein conserved in archaea [Archaeoglobus sulfaticallidus PM70-1]|uniref:Uncharacterized protein conserved in archaea n=1 Tax=Archaeoglobus sulfaticallidus PM70-1 TaxID=387631 RepID=N0BCS0_9EURY|nr:DUF166 domain-containing protein [Archaeoglobus sulfaticallidus]AGK60813.1 Uncharacterized protein conserved in archaea [Archaeoglobus sulfaticallidus PM70-1]